MQLRVHFLQLIRKVMVVLGLLITDLDVQLGDGLPQRGNAVLRLTRVQLKLGQFTVEFGILLLQLGQSESLLVEFQLLIGGGILESGA